MQVADSPMTALPESTEDRLLRAWHWLELFQPQSVDAAQPVVEHRDACRRRLKSEFRLDAEMGKPLPWEVGSDVDREWYSSRCANFQRTHPNETWRWHHTLYLGLAPMSWFASTGAG